MPFNGSTGTFNRLYRWAADAAANIAIMAARMDAEDDGFAAGLSNCVTRDGQSVPTADLPWGGHRITGLGAAQADNDALSRIAGDGRYVPASGATAQLNMNGFRIGSLGLALSGGDAMSQSASDARYVQSSGATAPLSMGGYRIGNLGAALSAGDALSQGAGDGRYLQLTGGTINGQLSLGGYRIGNLGVALSGGDAMSQAASDARYVQPNTSPTFANITAAAFKADPNAYLTVSGNYVYLNLDNGKYLKFDRGTNRLYFNGGSGEVMSIDASGNLRVTGQVYAQQAGV